MLQISRHDAYTPSETGHLLRFLVDNGVDFSKVNYYIEPLTKAKLKELLGKMKLTPRDILRNSEPIYLELGLGKGEFTDDEIISLMVKHPDLIQRPIVERGKGANPTVTYISPNNTGTLTLLPALLVRTVPPKSTVPAKVPVMNMLSLASPLAV